MVNLGSLLTDFVSIVTIVGISGGGEKTASNSSRQGFEQVRLARLVTGRMNGRVTRLKQSLALLEADSAA
jgi:hypothetical protein